MPCCVSTVDEHRRQLPTSSAGAVSSSATNATSSSASPLIVSSSSRHCQRRVIEYRPRPRRLSRYIQMRGVTAAAGPNGGYVTAATATPRWLQLLLNDDVHTGRNVGAKLAYMCDGVATTENRAGKDSTPTKTDGAGSAAEAAMASRSRPEGPTVVK